jgi:phage major head subunit gpT-like protein
MIINTANLDALRVGFSALFSQGLGQAETAYQRIATTVPSSGKENKYGWLGNVPNLREWIGGRVVNGIAEHDYSIKNKTWEITQGVDRDDIEDDTIGVYNPLMLQLGQSVAAQPDELVFSLLKSGFSTNCFDGQFFFDTDHPVILADGTQGTAANTDGGSNAPWFLLCTKRAIKPLIFQERKPPTFTALDNPNDHNVFHNKEFVYGVDVRRNVGFGFWQMAWGSKQTLNATYYAAARAGIMGQKGDHGRPLGLVPDLLVVPPSLESAGRKLLNSENAAGGETNEWKGTAELLVVPWLA